MSTFEGPPPTPEYTIDYKDRNINDTLDNINWLDASGLKDNRNMPDGFKSGFIITIYGYEKTANNGQNVWKLKNHMVHKYTKGVIITYAQKNKH